MDLGGQENGIETGKLDGGQPKGGNLHSSELMKEEINVPQKVESKLPDSDSTTPVLPKDRNICFNFNFNFG